MGFKVDNAVIMAAGMSSRFAPLSYEIPKALIQVKGEVLIERQIRQIRDAGIQEIIIVVGYKKEQFDYLRDKYNVIIVENKEYRNRNNNSSIYAVRKYLKNSYICSADNYFTINPFEVEVEDSYYSALYAEGATKEWCMETDENGYVNHVQIGGKDSWYMLGHCFWTLNFSETFCDILSREYDLPGTANLLWEAIYMKHLDVLKLRIRKYKCDEIFEFDSLDELREFDLSYISNTHSIIMKNIANKLSCLESEITNIKEYKNKGEFEAVGFEFLYDDKKYKYNYREKELRVICQGG